MSLPAWWPRSSCVYCGRRIRSRPDWDWHRPRRRRLTCGLHARLAMLDPMYVTRLVDKPGDDGDNPVAA